MPRLALKKYSMLSEQLTQLFAGTRLLVSPELRYPLTLDDRASSVTNRDVRVVVVGVQD
jgi:hypothetical protein